MASDMMVALREATQDGYTYFGHNSLCLPGNVPSVVHSPGREFAAGESLRLRYSEIPQVRHSHAVLGGRRSREWGYQHGVNERGVAMGVTPIHTKLEGERTGLTGDELVRLTLERSASACQALAILTDLIERYGQRGTENEICDHAFVVADCKEAYVLEAAGRHWVLAEVGSVRAVTAACLLRQDWDRISRGLATLAIDRHWWPEDGCKLDFAGAVGVQGPEHAQSFRRWGQATLQLEQHAGQLDEAFLRRLLSQQGELLSAKEDKEEERATVGSLLVRTGPTTEDLSVCWYCFAVPEGSLYFPLFPQVELPAAFHDPTGSGNRLWETMVQWQRNSRRDARLRASLHSALGGLQQRMDEHLHEFLPDANTLYRLRRTEELRRRAAAFLQYCQERFEELVLSVQGAPDRRASLPQEELVEMW